MILYKKAQDGTHIDSLRTKWKDNLRTIYMNELDNNKSSYPREYVAMMEATPLAYGKSNKEWAASRARRDSAETAVDAKFEPILRRRAFLGKSWEALQKWEPLDNRAAHDKMK